MAEAYPLQWPIGRPRRQNRKDGPFRAQTSRGYPSRDQLTIAVAIKRLQSELDLLGAVNPVISSNIELRRDGLPRSSARVPDDPGIAVYFALAGKPHCLPCDTYTSVAQNIAAIAAHIEASRRIERHGVASVVEIFAGFLALPSPEEARPWRQVLELHRSPTVTLCQVEDAYRRLARERHPDRGGSDAIMAELNRARDDARKELGHV